MHIYFCDVCMYFLGNRFKKKLLLVSESYCGTVLFIYNSYTVKLHYNVVNQTMLHLWFFSLVKGIIPVCGSDIDYQTSTTNLGARWQIPSYITPVIRSAFWSIDKKSSIGGNYCIFHFYVLFCSLFCRTGILYYTQSLLFL
jgi:hypothetical protein